MAKVLFAAPFAAVHGKVGINGESVAWTAGGRGFLRANVLPTNPNSDAQTSIRSYIQQATTAWQALTEAQAKAWNDLAEFIKTTDVFGTERSLSGIQIFVRQNMYRLMDGQTITNAPIGGTVPPAPSSVTLVETLTDQLTLNITHGASAGSGFWFVRLAEARASAARKTRRNEVRAVGGDFSNAIVPITASPQAVPIDVTAASYPAGEFTGVMVTPLADEYFPGTPFFDSIVPIDAP